MVVQGSLMMMPDSAKEYVVITTTQSQKLLSGGQVCCNRSVTSMRSDLVEPSPLEKCEQALRQLEITSECDMDAWVKDFLLNYSLDPKKKAKKPAGPRAKEAANEAEVQAELEGVIAELEGANETCNESQLNDEDVLGGSMGADQFVGVDGKPCKVKRNFKLLNFVKNAIKKHKKK